MDKRGQLSSGGLPMQWILIMIGLAFIFAVAVFLLKGYISELNPFK